MAIQFDIALIRLFKGGAPAGGYVASNLDASRRWAYDSATKTFFDVFGLRAPFMVSVGVVAKTSSGTPGNHFAAFVDYANDCVAYLDVDLFYRFVEISTGKTLVKIPKPNSAQFLLPIFGGNFVSFATVLTGFVRINGELKIVLMCVAENFTTNAINFAVASFGVSGQLEIIYSNKNFGTVSSPASSFHSAQMISTNYGAYFGVRDDYGADVIDHGYSAYGKIGGTGNWIRRLCKIGGRDEAPLYCALFGVDEGDIFPNPPITSAVDMRGAFLTPISYAFDRQFLPAYGSSVSAPVVGDNIQIDILNVFETPAKAVNGIVEPKLSYFRGEPMSFRVGGSRIADDGTLVAPPGVSRTFLPWSDGFNFGTIFTASAGFQYLALAATGVYDNEPCANYNWFS